MFESLGQMDTEKFRLHRKSLNNFLSHPSLTVPQNIDFENGFSNHFSENIDDKGRKCVLNYTLEHSEFHFFHHIDHTHVVFVNESADGREFSLIFNSSLHARDLYHNFSEIIELSSEKIIITGSHKWGLRRSHLGVHQQAHPILAEIAEFIHPYADGELHVTFNVTHIPIQKALKNADIKFIIQLHPEDSDLYRVHKKKQDDGDTTTTDDTAAGPGVDVKDSRESIVHTERRKLLESITTMAASVAEATSAIVSTAASIASGTVDSTSTATMTIVDYNYDPETGTAVEPFDVAEALDISNEYLDNVAITCTECYAYASVSLVVNVNIQNYNLNLAQVYVEGLQNYKLELEGSLNDISYSWENEVFKWTSPTVYLVIGVVPFTVYAETPVSMALGVTLTSSATVSASIYASATIKSGYKYDLSTTPSLQQISENSMSYGGTGLTVDKLCSGSASVTLSITPAAQVVVSFIGGPNVALSASVEAIASLDDMTISMNLKYLGTIGGTINVVLAGYGTVYGPTTFGPMAVVKGNTNLYSAQLWTPFSTQCDDPVADPVVSPVVSPVISPLVSPTMVPTVTPTEGEADDYYGHYYYSWRVSQHQEQQQQQRGQQQQHPAHEKINNKPSRTLQTALPDSWNVIGQTWYGTQTALKQCDNYPQFAELSAQEVNSEFLGLYIYLSQYVMNDFDTGSQGGLAAQTQGAYYIQYYEGGGINAIISPCTPDICDDAIPGWEDITYFGSTTDTSPFDDMYGFFFGNSMTFYDTKGCVQINMYTADYVHTEAPTATPSQQPSTITPTGVPLSVNPTATPTVVPTVTPSFKATDSPAESPSTSPSATPVVTATTEPSTQPSTYLTKLPVTLPTQQPSQDPSTGPSRPEPIHLSTEEPTVTPSMAPGTVSTSAPTAQSTVLPTTTLSDVPVVIPTASPSKKDINQTVVPTAAPTPVVVVTTTPTSVPSSKSSTTLSPIRVPTTTVPSTEPTVRPSSAPSVVPSAPPTANTWIIIDCIQGIGGLTASQFNSNDSYSTAFKQSVAQSMTGVYATNIQSLVITSSPLSFEHDAQTASTTTHHHPQHNLRGVGFHIDSTADSCSASYTVETNATDLHAVTLAQELTESVTSGAFNTYLWVNAANTGSTGLLNATSNSVETVVVESTDDVVDPNSVPSNTGSKSSFLNTGSLVGIIIGGVLVIVAAIVGCFLASGTICNTSASSTTIEEPKRAASVIKKQGKNVERSSSVNKKKQAKNVEMNVLSSQRNSKKLPRPPPSNDIQLFDNPMMKRPGSTTAKKPRNHDNKSPPS